MKKGTLTKPKINRFVKQLLDKSEFTCEVCRMPIKYDERLKHWDSCGKEIKCIAEGCAHSSVQFTSM